MATIGGGELATCVCGAKGVIVDRSHHLDMDTHWFEIQHENGGSHFVETHWTGEAFRFRMKGDG